ncbi:disulfide bond formation protein B [Xylophilus sp. GOD-11R]|uniref:disulfide bond formation protein B n=1 Tax=Xylophilus sp. GOD-11R TaxID=3089814 RepID=UPI00298C82B1|nr:disulfide bond formation protein B [Xylophilus sp. GOD-11R]WPB58564.1 disulfide bond formation protein B [Xylophilus sp. GOD-11R]
MTNSLNPRNDHSVAVWLNLAGLVGISLCLCVAFYYQLVRSELPCPLCLLQRAGLILVGLGFLFNIRMGIRNTHYAMALVGAVTTGAIALRQVFLHIEPGNVGYGSSFLGLHFYTWALVASVLLVLAVALMMSLGHWGPVLQPALHGLSVSRILEKFVAIVFVALIAGNLVSTVVECGAGQCADDPKVYEMLVR